MSNNFDLVGVLNMVSKTLAHGNNCSKLTAYINQDKIPKGKDTPPGPLTHYLDKETTLYK